MTISVDTNILVRYLTRDDEAEAGRAKALFARDTIFVTTTVLLELEWVLRSRYGFPRDRIAYMFALIAQTEGITLEEPERVATALRAFARGLDFADAIHVAGSGNAIAFATFDRALLKAAPTAFDRPAVISP